MYCDIVKQPVSIQINKYFFVNTLSVNFDCLTGCCMSLNLQFIAFQLFVVNCKLVCNLPNKIKQDEISDAVVECVHSHTIRYANGTHKEPNKAQS